MREKTLILGYVPAIKRPQGMILAKDLTSYEKAPEPKVLQPLETIKGNYLRIIDVDWFTHLRKYEWEAYFYQIMRLLAYQGVYEVFLYAKKTRQLRHYRPYKMKRSWNKSYGIFDRFFQVTEIKKIFRRWFSVQTIKETSFVVGKGTITYYHLRAKNTQRDLQRFSLEK